MYDSETTIRKEKEMSRIRAVKMNSLRVLLCIRRKDRVPNARKLCRATKGVNERINEGILRWFGHMERMQNDMIDKRVYALECVGNRSVGRPWKRWIDTMKNILAKRDLDVRQARKMVQDRSEWQGSVREKCMVGSQGDEPLTLVRCHSFGLPQLYDALV